MEQESHFMLLNVVLDRTACHVVSSCKHTCRGQALKALKKWFSGNDDQQNTIDSMLDDLRVLNVEETARTQCHPIKVIELIEYFPTLGEEMFHI